MTEVQYIENLKRVPKQVASELDGYRRTDLSLAVELLKGLYGVPALKDSVGFSCEVIGAAGASGGSNKLAPTFVHKTKPCMSMSPN